MATSPRIQAWRQRYRHLLRLYPRPYFERFGESMEQTFADLLRERQQSEQSLSAAALGLSLETALAIIRENITYLTMQNLTKRLSVWALIVAALLMIPLLGNWPWTGGDFIFGGVMLFGSALAYELISRKSGNSAYRWAVGLAVVAVLLLVWINGAVGIIGSENNSINLLYFGVVAIGIIGAIIARLQPKAMARTLIAMAVAQMLVPITALIVARPDLSDAPGIIGVFVLNAFFALLFSVSAALFRRATA